MFGLNGAPTTFQWMMDSVSKGTEYFSRVYLDDVVIYIQTWEDHLIQMKTFSNNLRIRMKMKGVLSQHKIAYTCDTELDKEE